MKIIAHVFVVVLLLVGIGQAAGGVYLVSLGGSPYYLIAGLLYLIAAVLIWCGRRVGGWLVVVAAILAVVWSLWESGPNYWLLFPRLMPAFVLAALTLLLAPSLLREANRKAWYGIGVIFALLFAIGVGLAFKPHGVAHDPAYPGLYSRSHAVVVEAPPHTEIWSTAKT